MCTLLQAGGHDTVHTCQLTDQDRTHDEVINELSFREQRAVVTRDTDFYHSHLLFGGPWKLLLIRSGSIRTRDLKALLQQHLPAIVAALENNSLVELDRQTVKIVA